MGGFQDQFSIRARNQKAYQNSLINIQDLKNSSKFEPPFL